MYVDLVLVEQNGDRYLFRAPAWSYIKEGEQVICETSRGEAMGKVITTYTADDDDKCMKFAVECCGASIPLNRIVGRLKYVEMRYPQEDENGNDSEE